MRSDYTHITMVLDSSGSMEPIKEPTMAGFNRFLYSQKDSPGFATLTRIEFGSKNPKYMQAPLQMYNNICGSVVGYYQPPRQEWSPYFCVENHVAIEAAQPLTEEEYKPWGDTPLFDAVGRAIGETGDFLRSLTETTRPEKVLFVIITDGFENASKTFNAETIGTMIEHQTKKYSWDFMYLGANQDAVLKAKSFGINVDQAVTYGINSIGSTYDMLGAKAVAYRSFAKGTAGFTASACFNATDRMAATANDPGLFVPETATANTAGDANG